MQNNLILKLSSGLMFSTNLLRGLTPTGGLILDHQAEALQPFLTAEDVKSLVWFVRDVTPQFDLATAYRENVPAKDAVIDVQPEPLQESAPTTLDTPGLLQEIAAKVKAQTGQDLTPEQLESLVTQIDAKLQEQHLGESLKPSVVSITTGKKN